MSKFVLPMHTKCASGMSRCLIRCITLLSTVGPSIVAAQPLVTNPLDLKARPYIENYNKGSPTMVAPTLRQERSTVFNGAVTLAYTAVTKNAAELAAMNLAAVQRSFIYPAICEAPDTGRMLREGYSFRYLYYGKDGKLGAQLVFLRSDCFARR